MSIKVNLDPLDSAVAFTYMGCTITYKNSDCLSLYHNLGKARMRWGMVLKVLEKLGETLVAREMMYKSVMQTVLL